MAYVFCFVCGREEPLGHVIDNQHYIAEKTRNKIAKAQASLPQKALLVRIQCGQHAVENVAKVAGIVPGIMLTPGEGITGSSEHLIATYAKIKAAHPALWVGVNFVGDNMYTVAKLLLKFETTVDGLWVDHGQYKTAHYCLFVFGGFSIGFSIGFFIGFGSIPPTSQRRVYAWR